MATERVTRRTAAARTHGLLAAVLLLAPGTVFAADCDRAIRATNTVASLGEQAFLAQNYVDGGNLASSARIPAIDAARAAKECGCTDALQPLEDAQINAARANAVINADATRSYGARIRDGARRALEALGKCSAQ